MISKLNVWYVYMCVYVVCIGEGLCACIFTCVCAYVVSNSINNYTLIK